MLNKCWLIILLIYLTDFYPFFMTSQASTSTYKMSLWFHLLPGFPADSGYSFFVFSEHLVHFHFRIVYLLHHTLSGKQELLLIFKFLISILIIGLLSLVSKYLLKNSIKICRYYRVKIKNHFIQLKYYW